MTVDKEKDSVVVAGRNRTKIRKFKIQDSTGAKSPLKTVLAIVSGRLVCQMWLKPSRVKLLRNSSSSKGQTLRPPQNLIQDPKQNISRRNHPVGGKGGGGRETSF